MEKLRLLKLTRRELLAFGIGGAASLAVGYLAESIRLPLKEKIPDEEKVLGAYPFEDLGVRLVEGWIYDGTIGDTPGKLHRAVDYVRRTKEGEFLPFAIYSMMEGEAYQNENITPDGGGWGKYVKVIRMVGPGKAMILTFAHLDKVNDSIPLAVAGAIEPGPVFPVQEGDFLGIAGTTGDTRGSAGNLEGQIQLHLILWRVEKKGNDWVPLAVDPYGIESRLSSGKYPQPGQSLAGLNHYFLTDNPSFAK